MKIRSGFVSNSSSASFIISAKSFPNVFALAKHMISKREWEGVAWTIGDKALKQRVRVAEDQGMDPDTPICFNTCNEETHIVREDDVFLVSTCHNHDFDLYDAETRLSDERRVALEKKYNIEPGCWIELCFSDMVAEGWYWYPEYNLKGKSVIRNRGIPTYCDVHHIGNIELQDGTVCCPACKRNRKVTKGVK